MKYIIFSIFSSIFFVIFTAETTFILLNKDYINIGSLDLRSLLIIHSSLLSILSFCDIVKYMLYHKRSKRISNIDRYINYPNY